MIQRANERQVGGQHYKTSYEHWDFVIITGIDYLEGTATKYLARWQSKGTPLQDLEKALHYTEKLIENLHTYGDHQHRSLEFLSGEVDEFCRINNLVGNTRRAIELLTTWSCRRDLLAAMTNIQTLIDEQRFAEELLKEAAPVPATDSNKHAERSSLLYGYEATVNYKGREESWGGFHNPKVSLQKLAEGIADAILHHPKATSFVFTITQRETNGTQS